MRKHIILILLILIFGATMAQDAVDVYQTRVDRYLQYHNIQYLNQP